MERYIMAIGFGIEFAWCICGGWGFHCNADDCSCLELEFEGDITGYIIQW